MKRALSSVALLTAVAVFAAVTHHHRSSIPVRSFVDPEENEATRMTGLGRCGVERWPVKTLTDPAAKQVDFGHVKPETVADLVNLQPPPMLGARSDAEKTVARMSVSLLAFKVEADQDIHLVVGDPANPGTTMIVEFPDLACTYGAQHRWAMEVAKRKLIAAVGAPGNRYQSLTGTATITGVLFFDFRHGQRGVAPNGIEVHPAIGFRVSP